jgi:hypothetical protein
MTQPTEEEQVEYADYYQCTGGLTVGMTVCEEGQVVEGSEMGFTESNPPLSEEEQIEVYGQVMYKEYDPEEDDEVAVTQRESEKIRGLQGMQAPGQPPVEMAPGAAEPPIETLSRQQLRQKAKKLGLNFPEDTDREQLLGAIQKKQQENAESRTPDQNEVLQRRRDQAKEAIEEANQLIQSGGAGPGGRSAPPRRQPRQEAPEEEEERSG